MQMKISYVNGLYHGPHIVYNKNGSISSTTMYYEGIEVDRPVNDQNKFKIPPVNESIPYKDYASWGEILFANKKIV